MRNALLLLNSPHSSLLVLRAFRPFLLQPHHRHTLSLVPTARNYDTKATPSISESPKSPLLSYTDDSANRLARQYPQRKADLITRDANRSTPFTVASGNTLSRTSSRDWKSKSIQELRQVLRSLAFEGSYEECHELARYLVKDRKNPPARSIFQSLLTANGAPDGSIGDVIHLLEQMKALNIELGEVECNSILRALAIHPDYVLRTEILQHMERSWLGLNDLSHHLVVASMLRELQLERALEELELMFNDGLEIKAWLYDLIVTVLVNVGEFEEALRIMRMRLEDKGPEHLSALWTHMLDQAAYACHYEVSEYIWNRCVRTEYINPSSGTCELVLTLAARNGNLDLTKSAIMVLKSHHQYLDRHHYELLIETHCNNGKIMDAIEVLCEMEKDKLPPDHSSTRPLFLWFMAHPDVNPAYYADKLMDLKYERKKTPIAALNVLIEVCVKRHETRASEAFRMYDRVRLAVAAGPDSTTFHHMFELCRTVKSVDWALKLANEHKAMGFEPNAIIYDGLIRACIEGGYDMEKVLGFYQDMLVQDVLPLRRTMRTMYRALRIAKHPESKRILDELIRWTDDKDQIHRLVEGTATAMEKKEKGEPVQPWEDENVIGMIPSTSASEIALRLEQLQAHLSTSGEKEK